MTATAIQSNNQRVCAVLALGMATLVPSQQWSDFEQVVNQRIEAIASFAPIIRANDNTPPDKLFGDGSGNDCQPAQWRPAHFRDS